MKLDSLDSGGLWIWAGCFEGQHVSEGWSYNINKKHNLGLLRCFWMQMSLEEVRCEVFTLFCALTFSSPADIFLVIQCCRKSGKYSVHHVKPNKTLPLESRLFFSLLSLFRFFFFFSPHSLCHYIKLEPHSTNGGFDCSADSQPWLWKFTFYKRTT